MGAIYAALPPGRIWSSDRCLCCWRKRRVTYLASNPGLAGERNSVDDPRCRCGHARFRDCWGFARNEILCSPRHIRRIALDRRSIRRGSAPSCHVRHFAKTLAIQRPLDENPCREVGVNARPKTLKVCRCGFSLSNCIEKTKGKPVCQVCQLRASLK
jgi:hypothetical protein